MPQTSDRAPVPRKKTRRTRRVQEQRESQKTSNLFDLEISSEILSLIPRSFAKQHSVFPLEKKATV